MNTGDLIALVIAVAKDVVEEREIELFREKNNEFNASLAECRRMEGTQQMLRMADLRFDLDYIKLFNDQIEASGKHIEALSDRISEMEKEIKLILLSKTK